MLEVSLIDVMGDDLTVVNAARVSFAKYTEEFSERDTRLIQYLASHNHWTPFSHCTATLHIKAPIFVARQLFKHKVGLTENEISRRYVDEDPEVFVPATWRKRAENKKQGSQLDAVSDEDSCYVAYAQALSAAVEAYDFLLEADVCPEQARMILPQSIQTEWYWTGSIASFARVCKLRIHDDAQYETRLVAEQINELLAPHFPVSWEVLCGHLRPADEPLH